MTQQPLQRAETLDFLLLGPFEVLAVDQPPLTLGRAEQSLLALMLLNPQQVLPSSRLVSLLWEEATLPADPLNALQNRVSKTRRALSALGADAPELVTVSGGYRLDVQKESVDVHRFTSHLARARRAAAESPASAEAELAAALALWRGTPLAGLEDEPWVSKEAHRLGELRLEATEERLSLAIATGRQREVVDELRRLVEANPLHEGMAHLLMRSLYLSGRQADALQVYRDLKRTLDDELGLEPSVHLRDLEASILRQDPELGRPSSANATVAAAPTRHAQPAVEVADAQSPRRPRRRLTMPNRVSSFVGRDDDIERLLPLVDQNQIVTLTGVGGAGKTSLAVEVARRTGERFTDGVVFIELAGLTEQRHAPQAVADALGLAVDPMAADDSVTTQLLAYLEGRSVLLVIDNCEHVIQACAELVHALTASSSSAHTLATSREALGVPGEVVYRLQPLRIPPADAGGEDLRAFASVRLFLDRMFAADPMRALQTREGDEDSIAAICRSLDGIPLAIELAAARSAALSLGDIAARLGDLDRFSLLTLGPRTAEARQRTLRATVDWSYGLLSEPERLLLRRLAVFRGGWSLAAAERVTVGDDLAQRDVTHLLGQLVHRSLVVPEPGPLARFTLLETIRVYALEQLEAAGEADEMGARHAGWVLSLAEESEVGLRGHDQAVWLSRLQSELDNIRAALSWAFQAPDDRADEALLLVGSLGWFYHLGRHIEGRDLFTQLQTLSAGSEPARARAHLARAIVGRPRSSLVHPDPECAQAATTSLEIFSRLGDRPRAALARTLLAVEGTAGMPLDNALAHLAMAEDEFRCLDDRWGQALAAFVRLALEIKRGTPEGAQEWGERAVALYLETGDHAGLAAVRFHRGLALRQGGLHRDAIEEFLEAARVAEPLGLHAIVHWSLTAAGVSALGLDELDEATDLFESAAHTRSERGDPSVAGHAAQGAALIARARGDHRAARQHYLAAYDAYRSAGTPGSVAAALSGLAWAALRDGDVHAAQEALTELQAIADETDDVLWRAWAQEVLAQMSAAQGDHGTALRLLCSADELRRSHRLPRLAFERREAEELRARVSAA